MTLAMLYKCLYNQGAAYISEFFHFKKVPCNLRGCSTRQELPSFNLDYMHRSLTFLACKLRNALPPSVRESQAIVSFKGATSRITQLEKAGKFIRNPS